MQPCRQNAHPFIGTFFARFGTRTPRSLARAAASGESQILATHVAVRSLLHPCYGVGCGRGLGDVTDGGRQCRGPSKLRGRWHNQRVCCPEAEGRVGRYGKRKLRGQAGAGVGLRVLRQVLRGHVRHLFGAFSHRAYEPSVLPPFQSSQLTLCPSSPPSSRVCGNRHGLIRKYGLNICRQCFQLYAKDIGFVKVCAVPSFIQRGQLEHSVVCVACVVDPPTLVPCCRCQWLVVPFPNCSPPVLALGS